MHILPGVVVHVSGGVIDVEGRVLVGEVQLQGLPRVPVHAHLLVHLNTHRYRRYMISARKVVFGLNHGYLSTW